MAKGKVFLDSSVIISSLLSDRGGSFYILNELKNNFEFQINGHVLDEMKKVVSSKFSSNPDILSQLLVVVSNKFTILKNPSRKERFHFAQYISENDAPILASSLKYSDILLTLDNEFFQEKILNLAREKSLKIMKPKELIESLRLSSPNIKLKSFL